MIIESQVSLKKHNSFGLNVHAQTYVAIETVSDLLNFIDKTPDAQNAFILGGGSNILLLNNIERTVLHNQLKGVEVIGKTEDHVCVRFMSGENWHKCVLWAIENNYGGIENLSLIPGTVGAAPMQNIGAYGVELKSVFDKLYAVEMKTGKTKCFSPDDCNFGYRESYFKKEGKNKYFITAVDLNLTIKNHPIKAEYGAIKSVLEKKNIQSPTIQDISTAVIKIRNSKLPDPKEIGNAGSFFKNPVISKAQFENLEKQYPDIPNYPQNDGMIKVPAGWLIEQAGFKGVLHGNTGSHKNQALVIVNYGHATGQEIFDFAKKVQHTVAQKFAIDLSMEVNIIGA